MKRGVKYTVKLESEDEIKEFIENELNNITITLKMPIEMEVEIEELY